MRNSKIINENGLTLVEVLASTVILSLIFIAIVTILNQSARMNKTSEDMINATFIVQQEMETLFKHSKENIYLASLTEYASQPNVDSWEIYHKNINQDFYLEIKIDQTDAPMVRVVVTAYETTDIHKNNKKAQMETLLKWGVEDETSS